MKKVLIVSFTDSSKDPRVIKQIAALKNNYNITVMGRNKVNDNTVNFIKLPDEIIGKNYKVKTNLKFFLLGYNIFYWQGFYVKAASKLLKGLEFDLILCNDLETLPVCIKYSKNAKTIFDAHEYTPSEFEDSPRWKKFKKPYIIHLCNKYLHRAEAMTTVCDGIAEKYHETFDIKKPYVITNAPFYKEIVPNLISHEDKIKILHHGYAMSIRKIENMIDIMNYLDPNKYELNLMLMPDHTSYLDNLKKYNTKENVKFIDPVPVNEIAEFISKYDIGLFLLEPINFNYEYCLPNKLFEFIQGRLCIAIGPSPEMVKIVKQFDCGVISKDFTSKEMAESIKGLTSEKINYFKEKSSIASKTLCAEENAKRVRDIISLLV